MPNPRRCQSKTRSRQPCSRTVPVAFGKTLQPSGLNDRVRASCEIKQAFDACQPRTSSGNRQSSQTAFECSQKSRTICIKPCCAAAVFKTRAFERSQQPLTRQFQNGIILRRRPREKSPFHFAPDFFIAAFLRANPQPRQNHVHRQIRHARLAQQRLRLFHPRRFERPVPRPEFIAFDLKNFVKRIQQFFVRQFPPRSSLQFLKRNFYPPASAPPARAAVADDSPDAGREISRPSRGKMQSANSSRSRHQKSQARRK